MPGISIFGQDGAPIDPQMGLGSAMVPPADDIMIIDRPQSNQPVAPRPRSSFAPTDAAPAMDPGFAQQQEALMRRSIQELADQRGKTVPDLIYGYMRELSAQRGNSDPYYGM